MWAKIRPYLFGFIGGAAIVAACLYWGAVSPARELVGQLEDRTRQLTESNIRAIQGAAILQNQLAVSRATAARVAERADEIRISLANGLQSINDAQYGVDGISDTIGRIEAIVAELERIYTAAGK